MPSKETAGYQTKSLFEKGPPQVVGHKESTETGK